MSYDLEHIRMECPCPCGNGRIVYGSGINDWNQFRDDIIEIRCKQCSEKYRFSVGGLLPIDFPEYKGPIGLGVTLRELQHKRHDYSENHGCKYLTKEQQQQRIKQYFTEEERNRIKEQHDNNLLYAGLIYAKTLVAEYDQDTLVEIYNQLTTARYSTELSGEAAVLAEKHKALFKTIRLKNVRYPVELALRNYDLYKRDNDEDARIIECLKQRLKETKEEYFKDYPEYQKKRERALIKYDLKPVDDSQSKKASLTDSSLTTQKDSPDDNKNPIQVTELEALGWYWYLSEDAETKLIPSKCGKWMHFFEDQEFARKICRKAIEEGVCYECKCRILDSRNITGVICFYLNGDDVENHRRVISFMLRNDLIPRTQYGRYHNLSFKYDSQTQAGEYGDSYKGKIKLSDFINLYSGEWI